MTRPAPALFVTTLLSLALAAPGHAQEVQQGTYLAEMSSTYSIVATVERERASLSVRTVGCIGEMSGQLARNSAGQLLIVDDDFDQTQCAIGLIADTDRSFQTMQVPECNIYHGFACNFEGYFVLQP